MPLCMKSGLRVAMAATIVGVAASSADAQSIPQLELYVQVNDGEFIPYTPAGSPNKDGTFSYNGYYEGEGFHLDFDAVSDPDPFVSNVIGLTNTSSNTNTYTFIVLMPTIAIPGSTFMGGSIGGSVTDSSNDGTAFVTSAGGSPVYTGLIDGLPAAGATLFNDPFSSPAVPFAGGTSVMGPSSFGLPGPTFPGPAVSGSIGIQLKFSLTGNDSAAITSFFIVEPVPAPAALALLGIAGIAGSRRRRN